MQKGGDVIWHGGDGGSFECSLSLLFEKALGSTTFRGLCDHHWVAPLEVHRIGRGPSVRVQKAVPVILAAMALAHVLLQQFLCNFSETYFLILRRREK